MKRSVTREAPEIQVEVLRGQVRPDLVDYARGKMLALAAQVREPILYARVKLAQATNPAVQKPAMAAATMDVNGRPARVSVTAKTMPEAIDALQARMSNQLARLQQHWESRRGRTQNNTDTHEWRHGNEPTSRPEYFPRPAEERELVRHKSFSLPWETPDEAAFEMDSMDYDFHLFSDAGTGEDCVIYRAGPTGYRLAQVNPRDRAPEPLAVPLTVSDQPAPRMSVAEAQQRLEIADFPFVFFADSSTGRGSVLYYRYDGHYGLITPVE